MHTSLRRSRPAVALLLVAIVTGIASAEPVKVDASQRNATLIREAFEAWRDGRGRVFDLLADDAEWTVAGHSPVSGVYRSRQALLDGAVTPIHARLATGITPAVRHIVAQHDQVVVIWDGTATTLEGGIYRNSYAWHLQLEDGRITRVIAFLDTWALDRLMD